LEVGNDSFCGCDKWVKFFLNLFWLQMVTSLLALCEGKKDFTNNIFFVHE
jgi:hypothetical protein